MNHIAYVMSPNTISNDVIQHKWKMNTSFIRGLCADINGIGEHTVDIMGYTATSHYVSIFARVITREIYANKWTLEESVIFSGQITSTGWPTKQCRVCNNHTDYVIPIIGVRICEKCFKNIQSSAVSSIGLCIDDHMRHTNRLIVALERYTISIHDMIIDFYMMSKNGVDYPLQLHNVTEATVRLCGVPISTISKIRACYRPVAREVARNLDNKMLLLVLIMLQCEMPRDILPQIVGLLTLVYFADLQIATA